LHRLWGQLGASVADRTSSRSKTRRADSRFRKVKRLDCDNSREWYPGSFQETGGVVPNWPTNVSKRGRAPSQKRDSPTFFGLTQRCGLTTIPRPERCPALWRFLLRESNANWRMDDGRTAPFTSKNCNASGR